MQLVLRMQMLCTAAAALMSRQPPQRTTRSTKAASGDQQRSSLMQTHVSIQTHAKSRKREALSAAGATLTHCVSATIDCCAASQADSHDISHTAWLHGSQLRLHQACSQWFLKTAVHPNLTADEGMCGGCVAACQPSPHSMHPLLCLGPSQAVAQDSHTARKADPILHTTPRYGLRDPCASHAIAKLPPHADKLRLCALLRACHAVCTMHAQSTRNKAPTLRRHIAVLYAQLAHSSHTMLCR
jgi:hypothetical protein